MCRSPLVRCLALVALLAALPAAADSAAPAVPAVAAAAAPLALDGSACAAAPGKVVDFDPTAAPAIGEGEAQPMIGCTASYNCVHGTIVTCSGPVNGTCSATGAHCGGVTCGGVTTWCPGACYADHHCLRFCGFDPDMFCDDFDCCECS
jgi:hypothetical protein